MTENSVTYVWWGSGTYLPEIEHISGPVLHPSPLKPWFFSKMRLPRPLSLLLPLPLTHVCSSSHARGFLLLSIRKKYLHEIYLLSHILTYLPPSMGLDFIHILWEDVAQSFSPVENVSFCKYQHAHSWSLWVRVSLETILRRNSTRVNWMCMICFTSKPRLSSFFFSQWLY